MKTITNGTGQISICTLLLFLSCFLFSLNSYSQKVQWMSTDVWNNGVWTNSGKSINTYDGNGYLTHDLTQNFITSWQNVVQNNYTNNPDGTVQQKNSELWSTASSKWEPYNRTTYTYTPAKKVLTATSENYYDPSWVYFSKEIYEYDGNNNQTKILTQNYDFVSPWKDASQTIYVNNPDGTVSQSTDQIWNLNAWKNTNRTTYTYTNSKITTELSEKWNGTTWENESLETYNYDSNGHVIHNLSQSWKAGAWKNESQSNITNNTNGSIHQIIYQYWNDKNVWENTYRVTFNYDALGVDEHNFDKSFTFSPNPAQDKITIKTDENIVGSKYVITDQLGRQTLNGTITEPETVIDVEQFSNGIYFIQIGQKTNESIKKLVKK